LETTLGQPVLATLTSRQAIEPEHFDGIVRAHQQRIYRVLLALVRDADAADTLTQECFLRAFQSRESFRGEASLATWLVRIAVNLARDHSKNRRRSFWRRLVRSGEAPAAPLDPHVSPEHRAVLREEVAAVWSAVDALTVQQRTAFVLRFSEEMPLEEIARAMGLEIGTVKSHLARAVTAVRREVRR
jgi:RNA polymerase sigma-70 factor (ECF subfamily)